MAMSSTQSDHVLSRPRTNLIVQKYGGSSLATPKHIRRAAERIASARREGRDLVVVVSAMGFTTDHLLRVARRTVAKPPERELDMLLTAGERISMSLLAMALHELGIPAISFTGSQSGILTNNDHTQAKIIDIKGHRILEELQKGKVVIIAGFQGVSEKKEITTLGRGGSDTTAVALAAKLGAELCEILTDVDGLFTADPRVVEDAKLISQCSYNEALELASLGAKMQPRSLEVARKFKVNVRIASAKNSAAKGTFIGDKNGEGQVESSVIRGIATKDNMGYIRTSASLKETLSVLKMSRVAIRFFSSSNDGTELVVEDSKVEKVCDALHASGHKFSHIDDVTLISMVGDGLVAEADLVPEFFSALHAIGVEPHWIGVNSLSVNAAIASDRKKEAAQALHDLFIHQKQKPTPVERRPASEFKGDAQV